MPWYNVRPALSLPPPSENKPRCWRTSWIRAYLDARFLPLFAARRDTASLARPGGPRHVLDMVLNLVGVAYYTGFWFDGEAYHSLYQIIQASRLIILWNVLHLLGPTTSGAEREK